MTLRVFSYGGGVQTTAALVLAAQGKIDFPTFLFANVGDDSEHPATLRYVREVAMPYAAQHSIALVELRRTKRDGSIETLYERASNPNGRAPVIPVRLPSGAPGNRNCTVDFKIRLVEKWLKERGASADNPATTGLGISTDELHRAKSNDPRQPSMLKEYPLITLRLSRADCIAVIQAGGISVPPKSSCWFCPFHSLRSWQEMRENEPELFMRAVGFEKFLRERSERVGIGSVYLTDRLVPLDEATSPHRQLPLLDDTEDTCESGYCMV